MTLHRARHPVFVDGCFPCKIASVLVAPSATPSRTGGERAAEVNATEKRWAKDHAAYKRLVADGLQPKTLDGASELERRATSALEVEHGLGAPAILGEINAA